MLQPKVIEKRDVHATLQYRYVILYQFQARGNDFFFWGARFFPGVGMQEQKSSINIFSYAPIIQGEAEKPSVFKFCVKKQIPSY